MANKLNKEAMQKVSSMLTGGSKMGELSDDDLDSVAGGAAESTENQKAAVRYIYSQCGNVDATVKMARTFSAITLSDSEIRAQCF